MSFPREYNLDKFYIEHNGYFSNHLSQGSIALFQLGCSKERFSAFVEQYLLQLELSKGPTRKSQDQNVDWTQIAVDDLKGDIDSNSVPSWNTQTLFQANVVAFTRFVNTTSSYSTNVTTTHFKTFFKESFPIWPWAFVELLFIAWNTWGW